MGYADITDIIGGGQVDNTTPNVPLPSSKSSVSPKANTYADSSKWVTGGGRTAADLQDIVGMGGGGIDKDELGILYNEGWGEKAGRYGITALAHTLKGLKQVFGAPEAALYGYLNAQNTDPEVAKDAREGNYVREFFGRLNEANNSMWQNLLSGGGEIDYRRYIKESTGKPLEENLVDIAVESGVDPKKARQIAYSNAGEGFVSTLQMLSDPTMLFGPMVYAKRAKMMNELVKGYVGIVSEETGDRIRAQLKVLDNEIRDYLRAEKGKAIHENLYPSRFKDVSAGAGGPSQTFAIPTYTKARVQYYDVYDQFGNKTSGVAQKDIDMSTLQKGQPFAIQTGTKKGVQYFTVSDVKGNVVKDVPESELLASTKPEWQGVKILQKDVGGPQIRVQASRGVDAYTKWRDDMIAATEASDATAVGGGAGGWVGEAKAGEKAVPTGEPLIVRDPNAPRPPAPGPVEIPLAQEAQAVGRSGGGVREFLAKVRERQNLPPVDWTGAPSGKLVVGQEGRLMGQQGTKLQRGEIFEAARREFGDQEAAKAARLIEQTEAELGITGAPRLERAAETLGARELGQIGEQVGKVEKVYAVPTYVDHVDKSKPPVQYYEIKGGPKDGSSLTKEQLDRLGIKIVEPKAPKVKAPEGVVVAQTTEAPKVEPVKAQAPKEVIPAEQTLAPKESALPEGTQALGELTEEGTVGGEVAKVFGEAGAPPVPGTLKQLKPGVEVPGFGKLNKMDMVTRGKDGDFWVNFYFEGRQMPKLMKLGDMTKLLNASSAPTITTDFMGLQTMFEKTVELIAKLKPKTPFQYFPPDPILFTPDWDKVVKQRKKGSITHPPVIGVERNVLMQANEIETRTGIGMSLKQLMQNPIRLFEEMGRGMKELFYYPVKDAEHSVSLERVEFDKWLRELRKNATKEESTRIGTYAIAQQENGLERLKLMGVDNIPVLSTKEQQIYDALRTKFDEFYERLNQARALSGLGKIGKVDNYFTFMNDFARLEDRGNLPFRMTDTQLQKYIHPKTPGFGYAKHRADIKDNPLELDAFKVMDNYGNKAIRHIHISPVTSKLNEMLGTFTDPLTGQKWMLGESAPNTYAVIRDWLDYQNGVQKRLGREWGPIERMLTRLNRNIPFAMLGLNIKSALIQPTAYLNTAAEIGVVNAIKGVKEFMLNEFGHGSPAVAKSKVLLGREYDVALTDLFNELRSHRLGQFQQAAGKLALRPLQYLDMVTAKATWYGAYEHAKNGLKLVEDKAIRYADDVVVRTQGSGARSDVAAIQRTSWGKAMMMFQTFVINDWNFIMKDVMGFGSPHKMGINRFKKVLTLMVGSWLTSALYEDMLGIQSPLARPTAAIQQAYDEGGGITEMVVAAGKEMLGQAPFIGGPLRMSGKEGQFGGPITEFGGDILKTAKNLPKLVEGDPEALMRAWSLVGRGLGVPGTWQVQRYIKRTEQGAEPWQAAVGVPISEIE